MARSRIAGLQKTSGSIIPEFDFSSISQATVDGWGGSADVTKTLITYDQFITETGFNGKHPLENLGQTHVLKCVVSTVSTAALNFIPDIAIASPVDISRGANGFFVYLSDAAQTEITGAPGVKAFFEDGSISHYRRFNMPVADTNSVDTWGLCGGLDEANYYDATVGTPDTTQIDKLRANVDTNGGDPTFYITSVFTGAKRKPIIMLEQDDISPSYPESTGSSVGESGTYHLCEDCQTYGFGVGLNGIFARVTPSVISEADLKTFIDADVAYIYGHGEDGMVTLADNDLAKAQIDSELASWRAFYPESVTNDTLMHHALPLGETNDVIRKYMKSLGYKTVRRVGSAVNQCLTGQTEYNDVADHLHLPSVAMDLKTAAAIKTHIDAMIKHGQDCVLYIHTFNSAQTPDRADVQDVLAHLRTQVDAGLCDVMPRHEWYEKSVNQYGIRTAGATRT